MKILPVLKNKSLNNLMNSQERVTTEEDIEERKRNYSIAGASVQSFELEVNPSNNY